MLAMKNNKLFLSAVLVLFFVCLAAFDAVMKIDRCLISLEGEIKQQIKHHTYSPSQPSQPEVLYSVCSGLDSVSRARRW